MNDRIRKKQNSRRRSECPCCGYFTLIGSPEDIAWAICPVCFWENDVGKNEELHSGANSMTLKEGRRNFLEFGACDRKMLKNVRRPKREELPENNRQR
ncbi:MAG: hypothetical protein IJ806_10845 [Ruminococcus sp.]|nr:hypothetical protein [Ruminococcus sp.]